MKRCIILALLLGLCACAEKQVVSGDGDPAQPVKRTKATARTPNTKNETVTDKVRTTFTYILTNDDKKAKLAYGRNYRVMPDFIQFAVDLRFRNYDHALTLLEKLEVSLPEKRFWSKLLVAKPGQFLSALCEELKANPTLDFTESNEQVKWGRELESLVQSLISEKAKSVKPTELDMALEDIKCKHTGANPQCEPLTPEQTKKLLNDPFFDKLHNMQVRDSRFVKWNYKNYIKIREYQRYVTMASLHRFFHAIQASPSPLQTKFLKRYRGIGRDLRPESVLGRVFGDLVVGDEKDTLVAEHFQDFILSYPVMNLALGLEFELATCGLPADMPPFKYPKAAKQ